jgi:hypothetical protein
MEYPWLIITSGSTWQMDISCCFKDSRLSPDIYLGNQKAVFYSVQWMIIFSGKSFASAPNTK